MNRLISLRPIHPISNLRPIHPISNHIRFFASKKNSGKKDESDDAVASFSFESYEKQMSKAVSHLKSSLEQVRIGRANPSLLDKVIITFNGKKMLLSSISQIHAKDAQTLMVVIADEEVKMSLHSTKSTNS